MPRSLLIGFALVLPAALGVLLPHGSSLAHGIVDQSWDESQSACNERSSDTVLLQAPLGMEFTPEQPVLVGVDVSLAAVNDEGPATITVRIREAAITGDVLGETSRSLADADSDPTFAHFDFSSAVAVTPGGTYVLEVASSNATHAWDGCEGLSENEKYPGGDGIVMGQPGSSDFFFRTYGPGEPATVTPTVAPPTMPGPPFQDFVRSPTPRVVLPNTGGGPKHHSNTWPLAAAATLLTVVLSAWLLRQAPVRR